MKVTISPMGASIIRSGGKSWPTGRRNKAASGSFFKPGGRSGLNYCINLSASRVPCQGYTLADASAPSAVGVVPGSSRVPCQGYTPADASAPSAVGVAPGSSRVPCQGYTPADASAPSAVGVAPGSCRVPCQGPCHAPFWDPFHVPFQGHVAFVPNAADAALLSYPASCRGRSPAPCWRQILASMNLGSPVPKPKLLRAITYLPIFHRKISWAYLYK